MFALKTRYIISIKYKKEKRVKCDMAVYVVGDFLRETRLRKGYTQEEVSYGICTPASLSRIENGAQKPGRLILEKLFERLGTENNLFNSFVSREEMELYSEIQTLIRDITDEDVARLEKQIDVVEKMAQNASELEHQCLYFAKGELARQKEKDDIIQSTKRELSAKSITIKRTSLISVITYWYMVMKNLVVKLIELNDYEKRRYRSNGRYISRIWYFCTSRNN